MRTIVEGLASVVVSQGTSVPGMPGASPAQTGAPASPNGPAPTGGNPFGSMMLIMGAVVLMFVLMGMGTRKEGKRRKAMLQALKKHDRVQTTAGIIGTVVEIKNDLVYLRVDDSSNLRIPFAKFAIQTVLTEAKPSVEAKEPEHA